MLCLALESFGCAGRRRVSKLTPAVANQVVVAASTGKVSRLNRLLGEANIARRDQHRSKEQSLLLAATLYMVASHGLGCDADTARLLMDDYQTMLRGFDGWKSVQNRSLRTRMGRDEGIIYCLDVLARSATRLSPAAFLKMSGRLLAYLRAFIKDNLQGKLNPNDVKRLRKYSNTMEVLGEQLVALCRNKKSTAACEQAKGYRKVGSQLKTIVDRTLKQLPNPMPKAVQLTVNELRRLQQILLQL